MKELIKKAWEVAYFESKNTGVPVIPVIDLATNKGIEIAKKLNANLEIVEIGTLLMDCKIGEAISQDRLAEHVKISADYTEEILSNYNISADDKRNIMNCVLQHHGNTKFHSIEAEICCNADCYRFLSTEGFMLSIRYIREMKFRDLIKLMNDKVEEKWNALTLDICKKELEGQYKNIRGILDELV